jgi:hypothetical protein
MKATIKSVVASMLVAGSLLIAHLAAAHHSTIGQIAEETTQINGTIKEFQFKNPHSWIQVDVTDDKGEVVEWSVEWGNPNNLIRQGYNPSTFKPGAAVTMQLRQHVSNAPLGEFMAARFGDGTTIGNWVDK